MIVNFPHNPTGVLPTVDEWRTIALEVERSGAWLFCDEMYRGLEYKRESRLTSGLGDVHVGDLRCAVLFADSGMGDLILKRVETGDAHVDSGLGDIVLRNCTFEELSADTGLGDITCVETNYAKAHLDSGLGSVTR